VPISPTQRGQGRGKEDADRAAHFRLRKKKEKKFS